MTKTEVDAKAVQSYQAVLSTELHPLTVKIGNLEKPFRGGIDTVQFGGLKVAHSFANSSCTCFWDRTESTRLQDSFRLQIQEAGESYYYFKHKETHCPTNALVLIECGSEVVSTQPAAGRGVHVTIPRTFLAPQIKNHGLSCYKPIDASNGTARILRDLVNEMWKRGRDLTAIEEAALTTSLIWLLGAVFSEGDAPSTLQSALDVQFSRISRSIERNFRDSEYSIHVAARELGISRRYVQVVLQHFGTSFSARLLSRRLTASRDMLAYGALEGKRVAEAAYSSGFNDLSYFSRSFSREFGLSPSAFRAQVGRKKKQ